MMVTKHPGNKSQISFGNNQRYECEAPTRTNTQRSQPESGTREEEGYTTRAAMARKPAVR